MRVDRIEVDTHVHSVISGHAWSTLHENVLQARKVGLQALCLTEHSCAVPGAAPEWAPLSMSMVPKEDEGIHIYHGLEMDVVTPTGELCPDDRFVKDLDFCIASICNLWYNSSNLSPGRYLICMRFLFSPLNPL